MGRVVVSFYFSNRPDTYITLILSPSNFGVSLKHDKIAKAGEDLDFALKKIRILVCISNNYLKAVTVSVSCESVTIEK